MSEEDELGEASESATGEGVDGGISEAPSSGGESDASPVSFGQGEGELLVPGLYVYLGTTQVGKTTKAFADGMRTMRATGKSFLVVDSTGARNFRDIPHVGTGEASDVEVVLRALYGDKPRLVVWTPSDDREKEDFERVIAGVRSAGNIVLLIDEVSFWARSPKLNTLFRVWAHANVTLQVTAQNVGADLGQSLQACNPLLYLFRITGPRSLDWVMHYHGVDPKKARSLPPFHYIEKRF